MNHIDFAFLPDRLKAEYLYNEIRQRKNKRIDIFVVNDNNDSHFMRQLRQLCDTDKDALRDKTIVITDIVSRNTYTIWHEEKQHDHSSLSC